MKLSKSFLNYQKKLLDIPSCYDDMHQIRDNIWLGNDKSRHYTRENGITAVISLATPYQHKYRLKRINDDNVIEYPINMVDEPSTNLIDIIYQVTDILNNEEEIFLVHCMAGKSRSPSVLIGYLMLTEGLSYEEAYNEILEKRPCINPNHGFRRQLQSRWIYL